MRFIFLVLILTLGCQETQKYECKEMVSSPYIQDLTFIDNEDMERTISIEVNAYTKIPKIIYHVEGERANGEIEHYYSLEMPSKVDGMLHIVNPMGTDRYLDFVSIVIRHQEIKLGPVNHSKKEAMDAYKCSLHGMKVL